MVDRRRPTNRSSAPMRGGTQTRRFADRPTRDRSRDFSPVRGDIMTRARSAADAMRERAGGRAGGTATAERPGQGAIDFGERMTGGDGNIQRVKDAIVGDVAKHLASKGIYQDERGTWQIRGLERNDPSISIRDSAVAAMGGPSWSKIVADADARLGANNIGLGRDAATSIIDRAKASVPTPQTRTPSGTPTIPGRALPPFTPSGAPTIPGAGPSSTRLPTPIRPVTGGVPRGVPIPPGTTVIGRGGPATPAQTSGPVTLPGLGVTPAARPTPAPTTTNIGAPPTTNTIGQGGAPNSGALGLPPQQPTVQGDWIPNRSGAPPIPTQGGGLQTPTQAQVAQGQLSPQASGFRSYQQPISPVGTGGPTPGFPVAPGAGRDMGRIGGGPGGQIIGSGMGQDRQQLAPFPPAATAPISPTTLGNQTVGGVSQAPAGAPVAPLPPGGQRVGSTTAPQAPMRPGQMPSTFPNGQPFGGANEMVQRIQAQVNARLAAAQAGQPMAAGVPAAAAGGLAGLAGLGDRIAQSVQGGLAGMRQGLGQVRSPNLEGLAPGGVGSSAADIMSRVQQQLAASRLSQMGQTGMPTAGSGVPTGGPTTPTTPAPAPAPTGTGGTLGSYGNASIDQWDQAFIAAGNKYGVDPTLLKAMMEIESGGNGNMALTDCRADGSCGPMQVKPGIWGSVSSVPEQIEQAAKILGDAVASGQYPNAEAALFGIYFPTDDVMNGTTQGQYAERVHQLQAQMGPYQPGAPTTGAPTTGPVAVPGTGPTPTGGVGPPQIDPNTGIVVTGAGTGTSQPGTGSDALPTNPASTSPDGSQIGVIYNPQGGPVTAPGRPGGDLGSKVALAIGAAPGALVSGQDVVNLAMQGLGKAYGGVPDPSTPLDQIGSWDCSGMTRWVLQNLGYKNIPMGSEGQYQVAYDQGILRGGEGDLDQVQVGDLVFYDTNWRGGGLCSGGVCPNRASHVAIYIGPTQLHPEGAIIQSGTDGTTEESVYFGNYAILGVSSPGDYAPQDVYY